MLNSLGTFGKQRSTAGVWQAGDKDEVGKDPVASEFDDDERAIDEEPDETEEGGPDDEEGEPAA